LWQNHSNVSADNDICVLIDRCWLSVDDDELRALVLGDQR